LGEAGAKIEPKIPIEDGEFSFEPNKSEVKEEDEDPVCFFPSISVLLSNPTQLLLFFYIYEYSHSLTKYRISYAFIIFFS
jgi:hypothetical protein